jgi:hypothetical protein
MVTFADPITREELSRIVEGADEQSSLDEFINSLEFSFHEKDVVINSLAVLPDLGTSPKALPKNAPDLFRNGWWL